MKTCTSKDEVFPKSMVAWSGAAADEKLHVDGTQAVISFPCRSPDAATNSASALPVPPRQLVSSDISHDPLAFETAADVLLSGAPLLLVLGLGLMC